MKQELQRQMEMKKQREMNIKQKDMEVFEVNKTVIQDKANFEIN